MAAPQPMMAVPPMVAQPPKLGMNKAPYPKCGADMGGPCICGCFCPCLAAKMSFDKLDKIRVPTEQTPAETPKGAMMCIIVLVTMFIYATCIGIWYQRSQLAEMMDYTPPDAVMDIICSWCCGCFTFMQDDKAINEFEPVYKSQKAGMVGGAQMAAMAAAPMQAMAAPMAAPAAAPAAEAPKPQ